MTPHRLANRTPTCAFLFAGIVFSFAFAVHAQFEVKQAAAGDVTLHYTDVGEGNPVVCIHGTLRDYREFSILSLELARWGYRSISYSRRYNEPNGNDAIAPDYSAETDAADLAAFLDALGLDRVHVLGHDFGGQVALRFAAAHPGRVASLILVEPWLPMWLPGVEGGAGLYESITADVIGPSAVAFRARLVDDAMRIYHTYQGDRGNYDRLREVVRSRMIQNSGEWSALVQSTDPFPPLTRELLAAVAAPVFVLAAGRTRQEFRLVDAELERVLTIQDRVVIQDCGHDMFSEHPIECAEAVISFLDSTN